MERDPLTLCGVDPLALALGLLAIRADWPLVGLASREHDRALEATLLLGCPAFPDPREPARCSRFLLLEAPDRELVELLAPVLDPGTVVAHLGLEGPEALPGVGLPLALRPLGPVPSAESGCTSLQGRLVALEGPSDAVRRGAALVEALGGRPLLLGTVQRLLALAAVEWSRRGQGATARGLWEAAGLEPALLPGPESWEGQGLVACEASLSALSRRLRELDPQAAWEPDLARGPKGVEKAS